MITTTPTSEKNQTELSDDAPNKIINESAVSIGAAITSTPNRDNRHVFASIDKIAVKVNSGDALPRTTPDQHSVHPLSALSLIDLKGDAPNVHEQSTKQVESTETFFSTQLHFDHKTPTEVAASTPPVCNPTVRSFIVKVTEAGSNTAGNHRVSTHVSTTNFVVCPPLFVKSFSNPSAANTSVVDATVTTKIKETKKINSEQSSSSVTTRVVESVDDLTAVCSNDVTKPVRFDRSPAEAMSEVAVMAALDSALAMLTSVVMGTSPGDQLDAKHTSQTVSLSSAVEIFAIPSAPVVPPRTSVNRAYNAWMSEGGRVLGLENVLTQSAAPPAGLYPGTKPVSQLLDDVSSFDSGQLQRKIVEIKLKYSAAKSIQECNLQEGGGAGQLEVKGHEDPHVNKVGGGGVDVELSERR